MLRANTDSLTEKMQNNESPDTRDVKSTPQAKKAPEAVVDPDADQKLNSRIVTISVKDHSWVRAVRRCPKLTASELARLADDEDVMITKFVCTATPDPAPMPVMSMTAADAFGIFDAPDTVEIGGKFRRITAARPQAARLPGEPHVVTISADQVATMMPYGVQK